MRNRIRGSLNKKVFLWVFLALTVCSILIYGIVMTVIPQRYQIISDNELEKNSYDLFSELQELTYDEGVKRIYDFCITNHASASLSDGTESLSFGTMDNTKNCTATTSYSTGITFTDSKMNYFLSVISAIQTADGITVIFLKMIPVILGIILLLSILSAWICSKIIVSPIVRISRISGKMAELDMTWKCDVKSSDEIGVLASNLNMMAEHLKKAMDDLEEANRVLREDVKKIQQMEVQRRHFFAAVSHELKTPLTILKGQIENMILGYGDYQNHEKYLPQTLKAAEDMEYLVQEILSVTKMETMNVKNTAEEISLHEVIETSIRNISPLADEKMIHIYLKIPRDIVLSVNRSMFLKAVSNVIGNAVQYSPCGEDIFIYLQTEEERQTLIVENTGVIISDQDMPYMFTPFYRVDKSRNKSTGGNGLGLYITKTILHLHGIDCRIENGENRVIFFMDLK